MHTLSELFGTVPENILASVFIHLPIFLVMFTDLIASQGLALPSVLKKGKQKKKGKGNKTGLENLFLY